MIGKATELLWLKSSYSDSSNGNDCVEIATTPHTIHIRDSKDPGRGVVTVSDVAWSAFLPTPSPEKV